VTEMLEIQYVMVRNVVTAKENISVEKVIQILYKKHVGSIIVVDDKKKCVGIFTERDAIRVVAQKIPLDTPLSKVMTKHVVTIRGDATLEETRRLVVTSKIRHLPVVDKQGTLLGVFSVRSFLDEIFGLKF
jgi:CBS domain-containing protein